MQLNSQNTQTTAEELLTLCGDVISPKERLTIISEKLLNLPYVTNPLCGSATTPEEFIFTLKGFDCVTYCETVLALTLAKKPQEVQDNLKRIRYHQGQVSWQNRNHYMARWLEENEANGFIKINKDFSNATLTRQLSTLEGYPAFDEVIHYRPLEFIKDSQESISHGSLLLFVSTKANLDYFHLGLAIRNKAGELFLRHAAKSIGCVNDELFNHFLDRNEMLGITMAELI